MNTANESSYPITFRKSDSQAFGEHISHNHSVVLIGLKRVGISNFLRFVYSQPDFVKTYIKRDNVLFTRIDLNDLIERETFPFWTLVLKRLVDTVEESDLPEAIKEKCRRRFSESIQLKDLFVTVDSCRKVIAHIVDAEYYPVIFMVRFDRMKDTFKTEDFANLQSMVDSAGRNLSFVFTSFRPLYHLSPTVFSKAALTGFVHNHYLTPAAASDTEVILSSYQKQYNLTLTEPIKKALITLSGGHVQYLHLAVVKLTEIKPLPQTEDELLDILKEDEAITLLSEELYESLSTDEQKMVMGINSDEMIDEKMREATHYLWDTGIVISEGKKERIFNALFSYYLDSKGKSSDTKKEFTRKEHLLFSILNTHEGTLVERDEIINSVWPEQAEMGVSDWAVDRLVARVRNKLKAQESPYEIVTIITRGYKLVKKG